MPPFGASRYHRPSGPLPRSSCRERAKRVFPYLSIQDLWNNDKATLLERYPPELVLRPWESCNSRGGFSSCSRCRAAKTMDGMGECPAMTLATTTASRKVSESAMRQLRCARPLDLARRRGTKDDMAKGLHHFFRLVEARGKFRRTIYIGLDVHLRRDGPLHCGSLWDDSRLWMLSLDQHIGGSNPWGAAKKYAVFLHCNNAPVLSDNHIVNNARDDPRAVNLFSQLSESRNEKQYRSA